MRDMGKMAEVVVSVDKRGRMLIPAKIRRMLNIKSAVKLTVENDKLVLEPIEDPLETYPGASC